MEIIDKQYTLYHIHSDFSNMYMVDSTTKVEDYVKRAKELGMTAIAFSELLQQGSVLNDLGQCCKV